MLFHIDIDIEGDLVGAHGSGLPVAAKAGAGLEVADLAVEPFAGSGAAATSNAHNLDAPEPPRSADREFAQVNGDNNVAIEAPRPERRETTAEPQAATSRAGQWGKRLLDIFVSGVALLLLMPLLIVLCLIVRLDSPGPAFYRRQVLGLGGHRFDAFKLRTMVRDGDALLDEKPALRAALMERHKLDEDPRITRCGQWMRRLSLDELPQLWNVLNGEMSLVGPRMISPPELARFGENAGKLLSVKPGVTGLWQVSGRSGLAPEDRVRLDLAYIDEACLSLDVKILFRTIPAVLLRRGAC